jgi:hypothetical protein
MESTNRRAFLRNSGIAVAAAGIVTALPASAASALEGSTPPVPEHASNDPVVAFVRNVRKGEVVLYTGENEVVVNDKRLASLLFHATR